MGEPKLDKAGEVTVQQICAEATKENIGVTLKKYPPPLLDDACDAVTKIILNTVKSEKVASGARLAGAVLSTDGIEMPADAAYAFACSMASPLVYRYPLLKSEQVYLPEKPPAMWEAFFEITAVGEGVLAGELPNCLINGFQSPDSKMPPLRAKAVAEGITKLLDGTDTDGEALAGIICEPDFATPCLVEHPKSAGGWGTTGKGALNCYPRVETSGKETHLSMIPSGWCQIDAVEKVKELLEDVHGIERVEAAGDEDSGWYKIVVVCKTEHAAASAAEAAVAAGVLKTRSKIVYTCCDDKNNRVHTSPQEMLRGYIVGLKGKGVAPCDVANSLIKLDDGARCGAKKLAEEGREGALAVWMVDSACRNKVIPVSSIKLQGRGGKGVPSGGEDVKILLLARVRAKVALVGGFGGGSILNLRAPDPCEGWLHPAETLPEGATMPAAAVWPGQARYVVFATNLGHIKKIDALEISDGRKGTKTVIKTSGGDGVVSCCGADEDDELVMISSLGNACRLKLKDVRSMGTGAKGIVGISIRDGDRLGAGVVFKPGSGKELFIFTSSGVGKRLSIDEIPIQNRGGVGVKIIEMENDVRITAAVMADEEDEILVGARSGKIIRFKAGDLSSQKRGAGGVVAMDLETEDSVLSATVIPPREVLDSGAAPREGRVDEEVREENADVEKQVVQPIDKND